LRVARLYSYNDIRIEEQPIPNVGPFDALLKTKVCGICSGDVMKWYIEKKAPLVFGHEISGEIVDVGNEVTSFKVHNRVFVHHHAPCFSCKHCRQGNYVHCETWKSSNIIPGGISEYILIPKINLENDTLLLPDNISFEDGALIEPTACVVKSLKRARIKKGDIVLVIGLGVMGQIHVLLSKYYGAEMVIGVDMVRFRLEKAKELGADEVIDVSQNDLIKSIKNITQDYMADIVIVCPNSIDAIKQGISAAGAGGNVIIFTPAMPEDLLTISPNYLYFNDISIITSYSCGPSDTIDALELIEKGVINSKLLITHRFTIEDTKEAFRITAEAKNSLKCIITFN